MIKFNFPIFTNNPELVYLDNAATTQKPQVVIDSIVEYYTKYNANVGRSICTLGDKATEQFERSRRVVQKFINASNEEEIIFTRGTTESINLVATILTESFQKGDEIILTELEHHSNLIPWQQAAMRKGLKLKFIPVLESGELDLEAYKNLFGPKVKLVAISHVSNVLGTVSDVQQITQFAHTHGALVVVDGAQAIAKIEVDVQALNCDFYAFSGHKIYGPTGIGLLYGKKELLEKLPAYQTGGKTIDQVGFYQSTLAPLPAKYEAGTPNIAGAIGLGAALEWLQVLVAEGQSHQNSPYQKGWPKAGVVLRDTKKYLSLPYNSNLKNRAKELRKSGNLSESILWNFLKKSQLRGLDFDRQKIIGSYIVDFYCSNLGLVIEIDGESHNYTGQHDVEREGYLKKLGLEVVHFSDLQIKTEIREILSSLELLIDNLMLKRETNPTYGHTSKPFRSNTHGEPRQEGNCYRVLFNHEKELTDYAEQQLREILGVKVFGGVGNKLGVIPFVVEGVHPLDVSTYLAGQNICLRSGHHCCQPLMHKLGVETSLRISFGMYNDQADVDYFIEKLKRAIGILS